ncbi:MAG: T9SS type A sorting domain-containing protein [Saprospiraceae bacterium]
MTHISRCLTTILTVISMVTLNAQNMHMYISDAGNFNQPPWQILKFDANGENGEVFISSHLAWPQDILFLEKDNIVLISNLNSGQILRFNATSGAYVNIFANAIGGPTRMEIGPDSLLYVLQWSGNGKVRRYHLDGTFVDEFTSVGVTTSIGLDWDTSGNLYVSSYNGKFVQKFSPSGTDLGKFISTNLAGPTNIWFDHNGDLLVNDYNAGAVKRFDSNGVFKSVFISDVPQCEGVDFLPDGSTIIGIGGTAAVSVFNSSGSLTNTIVPSGSLGLITPNAVVLRHDPSTTAIDNPPSYKEMNIVTPSIGVFFQFASSDLMPSGSIADVCTTSGVMMKKIMASDSAFWDASDLPDGMYVITLTLRDKTIARQKIMVQR